MIERRRHPRYPDRLGITVRDAGDDPASSEARGAIFHLTQDISQGGLRFQSLRPFEQSARLRIGIALAQPMSTVTLNGTVRWVHQDKAERLYSVGIELDGAEQGDLAAWQRYVESKT
jgi:hypothetical protein